MAGRVRSLVRIALATLAVAAPLAVVVACTSGSDVVGADDASTSPNDADGGSDGEGGGAQREAGADEDAALDGGRGDADASAASDAASGDASPSWLAYPCGLPAGQLPDAGPDAGSLAHVVDLGHANPVRLVRSGDRIASTPTAGGGILWDATTGRRITSGIGSGAELAGPLLVAHGEKPGVATTVRSSADGSFVFESATTLHPEGGGAYLWGVDDGGNLVVVSPTGAPILSRPGYSIGNVVFAAPGELRILAGPVGADVVETITVPGGTAAVSPAFQGTDPVWFLDGEHFFTTGPSIRRIYTKAGALVEAIALASFEGLGGSGVWYWTTRLSPSAVEMHKIGSGGAVATTLPTSSSTELVVGHRAVLAIGSTSPTKAELTFADLASDPLKTKRVPAPLTPYAQALAADSLDRWVYADSSGAMWMGGTVADPSASRPLSCGRVQGMSAAENGRVAIATSSGIAFLFDVAGASPKFERAFFLPSVQVALTRDGSVGVFQTPAFYGQALPDRPTRILDVPSGAVTKSFANTEVVDFDLARDGSRVARNGQTARVVTDLAGAMTVFQDSYANTVPPPALVLSPNGVHIAASTHSQSSALAHVATTRLYANGVLQNAIAGVAVGWIDDAHLLVAEYQPGLLQRAEYKQTVVVDASGNLVSTLVLPRILGFQSVSPATFFDGYHNTVYDVNGVAVLDQSALPVCIGSTIVEPVARCTATPNRFLHEVRSPDSLEFNVRIAVRPY